MSRRTANGSSETARGLRPATVVAAILLAPAGAAHAQDQASGALPAAMASLPHDLSPWSMFVNADIVVKATIAGLALASLTTWTIWLAKGFELLLARRRARNATQILAEAGSLDQAAREIEKSGARRSAVADLVQAASREVMRSAGLSAEGVKERVAIALPRIEARAGRAMARGAGPLATIAATAPFVGLFGTVWGIMNSFVGISRSHTTNLAVVAPGIAEALLATAIGLVAAIPAVIIYNLFARGVAAYRALLADASSEALQHVSRDLEGGGRIDAKGIAGARHVQPQPTLAARLHPAG
jgi:biopolymer transport protein ExbB